MAQWQQNVFPHCQIGIKMEILKNETELLMAKGYEDMASEDQAFSEMAFPAQQETLK